MNRYNFVSCKTSAFNHHRTNMTDLYLQRLVVDDGLLVFEGQLQLLVPLQQRLAQLRRQLQICN